MKLMKRIIVPILLILYCSKAFSTHAEWVVDLEMIPEFYERISNIASYDETLKELLEIENTKKGIITERISLEEKSESHDMYNYFYSEEDNTVYCAAVNMYSYNDLYYPFSIVLPAYCTIDQLIEAADKSYRSLKSTIEWEERFGPYQSWNIEKKAQFYSSFGVPASYEFSTVFDVWKMPDENAITQAEARDIVIELINNRYNNSFNKFDCFIEDIRFIWPESATRGWWEFRYWVKLKQNNRFYYSELVKVKQGFTNEDCSEYMFYFEDSVDPGYLEAFLIPAEASQ